MIRRLIGGALVALALATPSYAQSGRDAISPSSGGVSAIPPGFTLEFSIFARDRNAAVGGPSISIPAPVFVGALVDQSGITGFLKFASGDGNFEIAAVHPGDLIRGYPSRIETLSLDSIVLATEGQPPHSIPVGQVLPGGPRIIPGM